MLLKRTLIEVGLLAWLYKASELNSVELNQLKECFGYFIVVNLHVLFEVGARGKGLEAYVACVGFLTCVDSLMSYQVAYLQNLSILLESRKSGIDENDVQTKKKFTQ